MGISPLQVRSFGRVSYQPAFDLMQRWSDARTPETADEFWVLEHDPVYTQGRKGDPAHILNAQDIPIVQVDRGGQVTYHGPGQLVIYLMLDVRRGRWGIRQIVSAMENAVVGLLGDNELSAYADKDAPGVYVDGKKISALGLRVRNGKSYHGLSLNVDMDLTPFDQINPCGYEGLEVIQLSDFVSVNRDALEKSLVEKLCGELGINEHIWMPPQKMNEMKV